MLTCYINSIQMAEKITAEFHYGDSQRLTVSNKYSADDYINIALTEQSSSAELINLVNAIKDYGHYVQIPLAAYNKWKIGTDYAEMNAAADYSATDIDNAKTAVQNNAIKKDRMTDAGIKSVSMDLDLNSETTINLYLLRNSSNTDSVSVKLEGSNEEMATGPDSKGGYTVSLSGISAHNLGETYTLHVATNNNTFDIKVSALSYVHAVLNADSEVVSGIKNAVTSLYNYYKATLEYRATLKS